MPRALNDLTGIRVGMLSVVERAENDRYGHARWVVECDCGQKKLVAAINLKIGNTISCGCQRERNRAAATRRHGASAARTAEYRCWLGMRDRCRNPKNIAFKWYGGRGIRVCERWDSFANFLADMGGRPSRIHSVERSDVNGHYEPSNCRWATKIEQMNNTTANIFLVYMGRRLTVAQWAEKAGMKHGTLRGRLERGWTIDEALWAPDAERSHWRALARAKPKGEA